jgi:hypothetical protein
MKTRKEHPQPMDLDTAERLKTTLSAVGQGIRHKMQGKHETQKGERIRVDADTVEEIIRTWPETQKNIGRQMIEKYGLPNEATPTRLYWYKNGPWKRTELTSDIVVHNWPTVHTDFLIQVIDYRVPPEKFDLIAEFDGSILLDRTKGEVSARCDSESANVLGMNMVHEIVTGKRTVKEARKITVQNTVAYNLGRKAPYAERLLFKVPRGGTEDLDKSEISGAILRQTGGKIKDIVTGRRSEATGRATGTQRRAA